MEDRLLEAGRNLSYPLEQCFNLNDEETMIPKLSSLTHSSHLTWQNLQCLLGTILVIML